MLVIVLAGDVFLVDTLGQNPPRRLKKNSEIQVFNFALHCFGASALFTRRETKKPFVSQHTRDGIMAWGGASMISQTLKLVSVIVFLCRLCVISPNKFYTTQIKAGGALHEVEITF